MGVVGVAGPILVLDVGVILRALIDIVDEERDRRAGRDLLPRRLVGENARDDPNSVRLLPLRRETRLSGPTPIKVRLNIGLGERKARRTAVHHAADRRSVALAEGR